MSSKKLNSDFKKNIIIAALAVIAVGLILLIVYIKFFNNKENLLELNDISYKNDTFLDIVSNNDLIYSTGVAELQGYVEVEDRGVSSYVFFHITNSSSSEFMSFLNRLSETGLNGFIVKKDSLGIGCLKDNVISMVVLADKNDKKDEETTFDLSLEDSKKLLSSSKDNQVSILIRKDLDTSSDDDIHPCTSLITSVELVK